MTGYLTQIIQEARSCHANIEGMGRVAQRAFDELSKTRSPLNGLGRNQVNLYSFAREYPTWHSMGASKYDISLVNSLVSRGLLKLNEHGQYICIHFGNPYKVNSNR